MSPTSVDSQQAKIMMYGMPVMFTVFMLQMPSGLVLYILTNSVLTLFQTLVINKRTISL
jgi:YidC/Oxa1 family membrane protein insertase